MSLISYVGCVSITISPCVSTDVSVGLLASSIIGIAMLDGYFLFILTSFKEDGTSSMAKGSTTLPDRKCMSLQGTGVME